MGFIFIVIEHLLCLVAVSSLALDVGESQASSCLSNGNLLASRVVQGRSSNSDVSHNFYKPADTILYIFLNIIIDYLLL